VPTKLLSYFSEVKLRKGRGSRQGSYRKKYKGNFIKVNISLGCVKGKRRKFITIAYKEKA